VTGVKRLRASDQRPAPQLNSGRTQELTLAAVNGPAD